SGLGRRGCSVWRPWSRTREPSRARYFSVRWDVSEVHDDDSDVVAVDHLAHGAGGEFDASDALVRDGEIAGLPPLSEALVPGSAIDVVGAEPAHDDSLEDELERIEGHRRAHPGALGGELARQRADQQTAGLGAGHLDRRLQLFAADGVEDQ